MVVNRAQVSSVCVQDPAMKSDAASPKVSMATFSSAIGLVRKAGDDRSRVITSLIFGEAYDSPGILF